MKDEGGEHTILGRVAEHLIQRDQCRQPLLVGPNKLSIFAYNLKQLGMFDGCVKLSHQSTIVVQVVLVFRFID